MGIPRKVNTEPLCNRQQHFWRRTQRKRQHQLRDSRARMHSSIVPKDQPVRTTYASAKG